MLTPEQASVFLTTFKMTKLGAIRKITFGVKALANMRHMGVGPKYMKHSDGKIYYCPEDLKAFKTQVEAK